MTDDNKPNGELTTKRPVPGWAWLVGGLLLGVLLILAVRFATYSGHSETHYHANFGVYINGTQEPFKDPQYYQEVKICGLHGASPQSRTHMHNQESGVIHVHDDAVTWGQFFENLGWMVGPDFIRTTDKLYVADEDTKLNIVLNGQDLTDVSTITNQVISNKDRLLLSYGPADQTAIKKQFDSVPASADKYNAEKDPATCGSQEAPSVSERFKNLL